MFSFIRQINWLDIFTVVLLFRICYIALKNGLPAELFKFLGTILAVYLSLHYYTRISDFISSLGFTQNFSVVIIDLICFMALAYLGYEVFVLLRAAFYRFIKMEAVPRLNKWGGLLFGVLRGILLLGLFVFMLVVPGNSYLKKSVKNSYFAIRLSNVAPDTYSFLWNGLVSKFMRADKFNKSVIDAGEWLNK